MMGITFRLLAATLSPAAAPACRMRASRGRCASRVQCGPPAGIASPHTTKPQAAEPPPTFGHYRTPPEIFKLHNWIFFRNSNFKFASVGFVDRSDALSAAHRRRLARPHSHPSRRPSGAAAASAATP
jgi:hypothetical protein